MCGSNKLKQPNKVRMAINQEQKINGDKVKGRELLSVPLSNRILVYKKETLQRDYKN
jgi:hypothetical protein